MHFLRFKVHYKHTFNTIKHTFRCTSSIWWLDVLGHESSGLLQRCVEWISPWRSWHRSPWRPSRHSKAHEAGRAGSRWGPHRRLPDSPERKTHWWKSTAWQWPRRRPGGRQRSQMGRCIAEPFHTERKRQRSGEKNDRANIVIVKELLRQMMDLSTEREDIQP